MGFADNLVYFTTVPPLKLNTLTINRNRLMNNKRRHVTPSLMQNVVNPMYSFFNHSCAAQAHDLADVDPAAPKTSRCTMVTVKDIKKGDEVYTSYCHPMTLRRSKAERQQELAHGPWLGMNGCRCDRCLSEP